MTSTGCVIIIHFILLLPQISIISSKNLVLVSYKLKQQLFLFFVQGFRYELYCLTKEHKTTHCVVSLIIQYDGIKS